MELQTFISATIEQVVRGILQASETLSDTDAVVSPSDFQVNSGESQAFGRTRAEGKQPFGQVGTRVVQKIDFDIAVTVEESRSRAAGGKISVWSVGVSAGGEAETKAGSLSRVSFSVPVVLPSGEL